MAKIEFSAGGIVFKRIDGQLQIALILDPYDKWTFPKGRIEKGEKPKEAAQREVGEEIGIPNLLPIKLIDKIDYWYKRDKQLFHKFVYFFLLEAAKECTLRPQLEEIKGAAWFTPEEAEEKIGYKKDDVPLLKKAVEFLENPSKTC